MRLVKINAIWCPGCLVMHKVWKKIEEKYPDMDSVSYDYDLDEEIVQTFNPGKLLPVTILFDKDRELERLNGEKTVEEIINMIEKYK